MRSRFLRSIPAAVLLFGLGLCPSPYGYAGETPLRLGEPVSAQIPAGASYTGVTAPIPGSAILEWRVEVPRFDLDESDWVSVRLAAAGQRDVTKELNAGDRSLCVPVLLSATGPVRIEVRSRSPRELPFRLSLRDLNLPKPDRLAFEAEPNNSWQQANPLAIGRTVYGNNDDTDYLDNRDEQPVKGYAAGLDNPRKDRPGLDWFRLDIDWEEPRLVFFELDVLDRDVSVNLRTYIPDATGTDVVLFTDGKDPMEIVHDREPERYSKAISRVLSKGTYYLQVIGNHPRYLLRSRVYPVPPYKDPHQAVEAGAHYVMNVGDAWVAQVPREGNIYKRVQNMHDTALRCTACHPSIFSTEAVLTAVKAGYPVTAKSQFRYVVDRIYNGPTPLYGPNQVNWQRYIAIPMQSQGKHGMVLRDFEKYVSQRETPFFERYAPFLRFAWTGMEELHPDEQNGVVPRDSNVGFAVRDFQVLTEAQRRTGDKSYGEIAAHVRDLILSPDCNLKNIQDKIHRIWGFAVMQARTPEQIEEQDNAIREMLSYQNEDGGWPDEVEEGRASAVYTTGQVLWTLYQAGLTKETHPELDRAVEFLLSQQQDFGGWFQTTSHENFRTPMRETRYAVMGIATAYPLSDKPANGWGNRNGEPAVLPRTDSLVHTLDDLDNLWEVPHGQEATFSQALVYLLDHPEPLVRSLAAEALGRIGTETAVEPLLALLSDPVKDVWRSAAWAVRGFGNRGIGVDRIKAALNSLDPATRRGACRIFAYHYFGLDHRLDIAEDIMKLTTDPDLWTRLEALKTLRQWFYRSGEDAFKRKVVDLYIEHMGRPEHPAIRTNLAQGMYILLDENESGGVDIERNIARFPYERDRREVLEARSHTEQAVLLQPVLEALYSGNELQRKALLASFDGSFFAGRFYARNPRNMIDVGNDREFSFYENPPQEVLDRVFATLFKADLPAESLDQAVQLAAFFHVPKRTEDPLIQGQFLDLMNHESERVREQARKLVSQDLAFNRMQAHPELIEKATRLLESQDREVQLAVAAAVARNATLLHNVSVASIFAKWAANPDAFDLVLPVADTDLLSDKQALEVIKELWKRAYAQEDRRVELLKNLFKRSSLVDLEDPDRDLTKFLKIVSLDEVTAIREDLFARLENTAELRKSPRMNEVLHSGLSDRSAGIRLRSLELAQEQVGFWREGDTLEYALKLLVDPDPKIRALALDSVERFDLLSVEPRFARRVKPLMEDSELGEKAEKLLIAKGLDPASVESEGTIQTFGIPDLELFKTQVNPYFYEPAADGHSCSECHQNHTILRISEWSDDLALMPEDRVIQNFNSALKVVNLSDPEQSLILRKPRSPEGQGGEAKDSPTGLTHVGGARWPSKTHPGYQALLAWIQDAASSQKRRLGTLATVDSYSPDFPPELALDNDPRTLWHTEFVGAMPDYPHEIVVDLGAPSNTSAFQYVPRQETANGRVKEWEIRVSSDGTAWSEPIAAGIWENDAALKTVSLPVRGIRYVKLRGLSSVDGKPYMSAAEVIVLRDRESDQESPPGS